MKSIKLFGLPKIVWWLLVFLLIVGMLSLGYLRHEIILFLTKLRMYQTVSRNLILPMDNSVNKSSYVSYTCGTPWLLNQASFFNNALLARRINVLQQYCSLVPIPLTRWTKAKRYSESDVAFLIFTGTKFYHSRTTAIRDTWVSRVTNYYFLGETHYPTLPITVIDGAGSDYLSNMKKHFHGLEIVYKEQQAKSQINRQKWFFVVGDDAFINVHYIMKRLDSFDYRQPMLIGGHAGSTQCPNVQKNIANAVLFPSGGAGFFLSAKLLELMQSDLTNYLENVWYRNDPSSDVALTCLAFKLGVRVTTVPGFWAHPPARTLSLDGRKAFHGDPEPNNYHYVSPDEMYTLDEFYMHQYVDRLVNNADWISLIEFIRHFIATHYELLAIKRRECKLQPISESTTI